MSSVKKESRMKIEKKEREREGKREREFVESIFTADKSDSRYAWAESRDRKKH